MEGSRGEEAREEDVNNIEDDYVSVDEETIKKNCENLEINNIEETEEEKYDNVDIIEGGEEKQNKSVLEKFIQGLLPDNKDDAEKGTIIEEEEENKDLESNVITNIEDILSPRKEQDKEKEVKQDKEKEVKQDKEKEEEQD